MTQHMGIVLNDCIYIQHCGSSPSITENEPQCQCGPSEDSDQPAHSRSLIRIFTGRISASKGCKTSS